jgi:hypothetical protein
MKQMDNQNATISQYAGDPVQLNAALKRFGRHITCNNDSLCHSEQQSFTIFSPNSNKKRPLPYALTNTNSSNSKSSGKT